METIINVVVITFVVAVVYYVEVFIYKEPLTEKEILNYQKAVDQVKDAIKVAKYRARLGLNTKTQLLLIRRETKAYYFIFLGIVIAFIFVALLIFTEFLSSTNIAIMCISAIMLICYGIIKMSTSKTLAIGLLSFISISGTLARIAFDKTMEMSSYAYFYLFAVIVLIGIFSLSGRELKKV